MAGIIKHVDIYSEETAEKSHALSCCNILRGSVITETSAEYQQETYSQQNITPSASVIPEHLPVYEFIFVI